MKITEEARTYLFEEVERAVQSDGLLNLPSDFADFNAEVIQLGFVDINDEKRTVWDEPLTLRLSDVAWVGLDGEIYSPWIEVIHERNRYYLYKLGGACNGLDVFEDGVILDRELHKQVFVPERRYIPNKSNTVH